MTAPVRLDLPAGELASRVRTLRALQSPCRLCPRACGSLSRGLPVGARGAPVAASVSPVDGRRSTVNRSPCGSGPLPRVAAAFPHFGEEACLVGRGGSGTVFLEGCSLGCGFCQNHDLSRGGGGRACTPDDLADLFLALAAAGCENLNWVTPSHVAADLVDALDRATSRGLRLPVVWNTSAYDAPTTLDALDGVVDVWLPDLKTLDRARADAWMGAPDYPDVARAAVARMVGRSGDLRVDRRGVATGGVLVRHLVMPGASDDARAVMAFLATLGPVTVNVMDQYRPMGDADRLAGLGRRATAEEVRIARNAALEAGLRVL